MSSDPPLCRIVWRAALAAMGVLLCFASKGVQVSGIGFADLQGSPYTVGTTARGLTINGSPTLLLSGDVHYARALPAEQDRALDRLKADGLNTVQTYVTHHSIFIHTQQRGWDSRRCKALAACGPLVRVRVCAVDPMCACVHCL